MFGHNNLVLEPLRPSNYARGIRPYSDDKAAFLMSSLISRLRLTPRFSQSGANALDIKKISRKKPHVSLSAYGNEHYAVRVYARSSARLVSTSTRCLRCSAVPRMSV